MQPTMRGVAWRGVAGVDLILVPGRLVFGHAHGRAMGWVWLWLWLWLSPTKAHASRKPASATDTNADPNADKP